MTYEITWIDEEARVKTPVCRVTFPSCVPEEVMEATVEGFITQLDSATTFGVHIWVRG